MSSTHIFVESPKLRLMKRYLFWPQLITEVLSFNNYVNYQHLCKLSLFLFKLNYMYGFVGESGAWGINKELCKRVR